MYEPEALNKILEQFCATVQVRRRGKITNLEHSCNNYCYRPIPNRERVQIHYSITDSKVLEGKARLLRRQSKGRRPNKARSLTTTEENKLWDKRSWEREVRNFSSKHFCGTWPSILAFKVARKTTVEDFSSGLDENKTENFEFIENLSGLSAKPRSFLPKMFATGCEEMSRYNFQRVLPNYTTCYFICLVCQLFSTNDSRWEWTWWIS